MKSSGRNTAVHATVRRALLVPRRDMEPDGFHRNIHANVMFATWLDRIPCGDLRAGGIIQFIFLVSRPIRGDQNLKPGDQVAESSLRCRSGSFSPIANELSSNIVVLRSWGFLDNALLRSCECYCNPSSPIISLASADTRKSLDSGLKDLLEVLAEIIATGSSCRGGGRSDG